MEPYNLSDFSTFRWIPPQVKPRSPPWKRTQTIGQQIEDFEPLAPELEAFLPGPRPEATEDDIYEHNIRGESSLPSVALFHTHPPK